ncbi:unnamed protein product [Brassica oleracea]
MNNQGLSINRLTPSSSQRRSTVFQPLPETDQERSWFRPTFQSQAR